MCTHSFNEPEKNIESQSIADSKAIQINLDELEPIEISAQYSNGVTSYLCSGNIFMDKNEVRIFLADLYEIADTKVIIHGCEDIEFQNMVDLLNICKNIGFSNVGFATGVLK